MTGFKQRSLITLLVLMASLTPLFTACSTNSSGTPQPVVSASKPWSFGVISDTQWTIKTADGSAYADDGYSPNTVPANIIKQVDQQFIKAGVKFVTSMGDNVDWSNKTDIDTRVLYAQDLYNAGIGFYAFRGNHEVENPAYSDSAAEFLHVFPQIGTGVQNNLPTDVTSSIIPATDLANNPPANKTGSTFTLGSRFTFPTAVNDANKSLSYSFMYNNVTFMMLDQFDATSNSNNSTISQQQQWINSMLSGRPANTLAFVFSHKNLLGGNHKDNLFGAQITTKDPGDGNGVDIANLTAENKTAMTTKLTAENNFIASLQANNVPYIFSGHDHHYYVSLVNSPDGKSKVHQFIMQSDSSKFYVPPLHSTNDIPIQEDLNRVCYYIFTVDGPCVTIDYYGDTKGGGYYGANGGTFNFVKWLPSATA